MMMKEGRGFMIGEGGEGGVSEEGGRVYDRYDRRRVRAGWGGRGE